MFDYLLSCRLDRPLKPEIPTVDAISAESVSVDWNCAENVSSPLSYIVQHKSKESTVWLSECNAVDKPPVIISGLKDGVAYVFRVAARNENGISEFSDESNPYFAEGIIFI